MPHRTVRARVHAGANRPQQRQAWCKTEFVGVPERVLHACQDEVDSDRHHREHAHDDAERLVRRARLLAVLWVSIAAIAGLGVAEICGNGELDEGSNKHEAQVAVLAAELVVELVLRLVRKRRQKATQGRRHKAASTVVRV